MSKAATTYNPSGLLDHLIGSMKLKNDADLARRFGLHPPAISKVRHNRIPAGPAFLIKAHEIGGMTFPQIRQFVPANRELEAA